MQLNRRNNTISVLNKGLAAAAGPWSVAVAAYDTSTGASLPLEPPISVTLDVLPANTVIRLPTQLKQPPAALCDAVVLYRVSLTQSSSPPAMHTPTVSDYLLSTLSSNSSVPQNFSALAAARYSSRLIPLSVTVVGQADRVDRFGRSIFIFNATLHNPGPAVAVAVSVSLRSPMAAVTAETGFLDDRVLPQWADAGLFNLLRDERREVRIEAALRSSQLQSGVSPTFYVLVNGWNVVKSNVSAVFF